MNDLEAVRVGRWKLHVAKRGVEMCELYDLDADIGETTDLAAANPEVVAELDGARRAGTRVARRCATRPGRRRRAPDRPRGVTPKRLTTYDPTTRTTWPSTT